MAELQAKTRSKSKRSGHVQRQGVERNSSGVNHTSPSSGSRISPFYSAGPVFSLGSQVQTKVAIGQPNDPFEREADAVADRVTSGATVQPSAISSVTPGALAQTMPAEEKKPEQKVEDKKPVQKAETKKPEQKVEDKKSVQKAEAKKPEEKKPEQKPVQKVDQKKPDQKIEDKKPVQKAEAKKPEEKKPEEKKPAQKPVQKAEMKKPEEKKPEQKPIQKAEAKKPEEKKPEPMPIQRQSEPMEDFEEKPVQAEAGPAGGSVGSTSMASAADQAIASKGPGTPLNPATRGALESHMGADFSHVRIHDDSPAQQAASALNAHAFTQGNDIWLGPGASQRDQRLMAHEATHVVQQAGGVQRKLIQMAKGKSGSVGAGDKKKAEELPPAKIEGDKITIPTLLVPKYARKANAIPATNFVLTRQYTRPQDQRQVWIEDIAKDSTFKDKVKDKVKDAPGVVPEGKSEDQKVHVLESKVASTYFIGTKDTLPVKLAIPSWSKKGGKQFYDVDHIKEMQLGGENIPDNMELLNFSTNRSSGSKIHNELTRKISHAIAPEVGPGKKFPKVPDPKTVRSQYDITFEKVELALDLAGDSEDYWSPGEIKGGAHFEPLQPLSLKEIERRNLIGEKTRLTIYPSLRGGKPQHIKSWNPTSGEFSGEKEGFFRAFNLTHVKYQPGSGGSISGIKFSKSQTMEPKAVTWGLGEMDGLEYTAYVERPSLTGLLAKPLSPIEIIDIDVDDAGGLIARGVLSPSIPLFKKIDIDLLIDGDDITLSKTFSAGDFEFPGPFKVTSSSLTVSLGTRGLGISGELDFEIERVGQGKLEGEVSTSEGFAVKGDFKFDPKLFDGRLEAWYRDNTFGAKGTLRIPEGKITGIKSATIEAAYGQGCLEASGKAELSIPGIKSAELALSYSDKEGLTIGGGFELANNIPGIKSGSGKAMIKQKPGGEGYEVTASGNAVPNIPGISATINVAYENGALTIEGSAAYEKGMLKGSVLIGVTNRPVDDAGKPGGEPTKQLRAYGGGTVTIRIAPWLQGTIGIKLLPNGEMEVSGEIGLPSSLDIFPEKKLDKNLFTMPSLDIPIVGVSVLGKRVGIFASIGGGLDLSAGIGPGQLQELGLSVTYNPAHEEQTKVHGGAKLHIPAHAGLRLYISGSIGAGLLIVSAQGGIEIGGSLGLEGALDAGVQVDWTPTKGLVLDAKGEVYVEPKLRFDITGFVKVEADLLLKTVNLYEKRWELAAFEYGSGLRFGVKFPIHYEEGKPFNISLSDLEFQVPEVKPKEILGDLIKKIA